MCLAIPMKITKLDPPRATGEAGGIAREIRVDFLENPKVGDYVAVHAGFAIEKMTPEEALANIRLFEEIQNAL